MIGVPVGVYVCQNYQVPELHPILLGLKGRLEVCEECGGVAVVVSCCCGVVLAVSCSCCHTAAAADEEGGRPCACCPCCCCVCVVSLVVESAAVEGRLWGGVVLALCAFLTTLPTDVMRAHAGTGKGVPNWA